MAVLAYPSPFTDCNPSAVTTWLRRHTSPTGDLTLIHFQFMRCICLDVVASVRDITDWFSYQPDSGILDVEFYERGQVSPECVAYHAAAVHTYMLEQQAAVQRARVLLEAHLTTEQRIDLQYRGGFLVRGGVTGSLYCLRRMANLNVFRQSQTSRSHDRYCLIGKRAMPIDDLLLVQKMLLECDEEAFLRTAKQTRAEQWPY